MEMDPGKVNSKEINTGTEKSRASSEGGSLKESPNLDFVLDIPLEISVELGRAKMLISDLLQLGQGSVIELNKLAGEPVEIFVNQKLIARGEVVVVNDKFGIKMTDILSPMERVKQLGS
jgi:flagellar motor switch protein FliN/FliY